MWGWGIERARHNYKKNPNILTNKVLHMAVFMVIFIYNVIS